MITLSELRSLVKETPLTKEKEAPGRKQLIKNGGGVVDRADFADNSFVEVYTNGYVYYERGERWTSFSLQDVFQDYEYESVIARSWDKILIDSDYFMNLPWIIRVLMEGEDRIEYNISKSRIERNAASFDTTYSGGENFGTDENDALTILLRRELSEMLFQSFCMITKYQQEIIEECIIDARKTIDVAADRKITHQAVSDAIKKGTRNLRKALAELYGDDE